MCCQPAYHFSSCPFIKGKMTLKGQARQLERDLICTQGARSPCANLLIIIKIIINHYYFPSLGKNKCRKYLFLIPVAVLLKLETNEHRDLKRNCTFWYSPLDIMPQLLYRVSFFVVPYKNACQSILTHTYVLITLVSPNGHLFTFRKITVLSLTTC